MTLPANFIRWRLVVVAVGVVCAALIGWTIHHEMTTSERQARLLSEQAGSFLFWLSPGDQERTLVSPDGPMDVRRGYVRVDEWSEQLQQQRWRVSWQATGSDTALAMNEAGLFPLYDPAPQAGLTILSEDGFRLYDHHSPRRVIGDFADLPDLLVDSLLFIENRELLEPGYQYRNPAVEWRRFTAASVQLVGHELGLAGRPFGGSTLATQLEKFRHSPRGQTIDEPEKLRQMATASLRAYRHGPDTDTHRRQLVVDYLNDVPLAAFPGHGEVRGIYDGLRVWFGADADEVFEALDELGAFSASSADDGVALDDGARAFRKVLSLFLAHRRPSYYLLEAPEELFELTDAYIRLMAAEGFISDSVRDAALAVDTPVAGSTPHRERPDFAARKAVDAVRVSLLDMLDVDNLYQLDRHDLYVQSTLDATAQQRISDKLRQFTDPEFIEQQGLYGHRLLRRNDPLDELTVSFTLFERTERGNALRVLADNHDQPLNINEHVKLDLGSTAKLRTLVTYLETVARLHDELHHLGPGQLETVAAEAPDGLRRWAAARLADVPQMTVDDLLEAAMDRKYSANPNERFFTGGGLHRFSNFENRRNHTQSVREAFRHSVNLVFIRMMRDIVDYYIWLDPDRVEGILDGANADERAYMLSRFADMEGRKFQGEFFQDYAVVPRRKIPDAVVEGRNRSAESYAMVATVFADATPETVRRFVARHTGNEPTDRQVQRWWEQYQPETLNWQDRGYLTNIHPLELWTAAWLYDNPESTFRETMTASRQVRQQVYTWLFRTRSPNRQDSRIRTLFEQEAFDQIHHAWQRVGYPFDDLVASLATSIGSSADRPLALAQLVGILLNDGKRLPDYRVEALIAAPGTPYETRLERTEPVGDQVLPAPVARVALQALFDVVDGGTARRIDGQLLDSEGNPRRVGGKTGTGDHDRKIFDGLRLIDVQPIHRTATFAFVIDDRFFGVATVFVSGEPAGQFRFTSAISTTLLKVLHPALSHLLDRRDPLDGAPPDVTDPGQPLALAAGGAEDRRVELAAVRRFIPGGDHIDDLPTPLGWHQALEDAADYIPYEPPAPPSISRPLDWQSLLVPDAAPGPDEADPTT